MDDIDIKIDEIYIPAKLRQSIDRGNVEALAESILEEGLQVPISVRQGDQRYVLVTGLHRLEACKSLGEDTILAIVVGAKKH
jgi:ParB/RepB/Spo0J family partition protein